MLQVLLNTNSLLDYHRTGIPHYTWHLFNGMFDHQDISCLYAFNDQQLVKYFPSRSDKQTGLNALQDLHQKRTFFKQWLSKFRSDNFEKFSKTKSVSNVTYMEPNFIVKPFEGSCITTLHDLTCVRFPELQPTERVAWFEAGLQKTLDQAKHIISVSNFTRNEAIRYLGIAPEKITTVYNGVADDFKPRSQEELHRILKKYKLDHKGYILSVGTLEPRKNITNLLNGYLQLPLVVRERFPLVLVGAIGWKIQDLIKKIKKNSLNEVRLLGYIPQSDIVSIFSGAKAFCYLSTYEGFGLPVLEAMASGVPVLTSIQSAMAEFSGEQASLVNPLDTYEICQGIQHLLDDEQQKKALSLANYYRESFSWKKCISNTIQILKNYS